MPLLVWAPPYSGAADLLPGRADGAEARRGSRIRQTAALVFLRGRFGCTCPTARRVPTSSWSAWGRWRPFSSSVFDHARTDFSNPWLWAPTGVGIFATVVAAFMGGIGTGPARADLWTSHRRAMVLMVLVGVAGCCLHISTD